MNKRARNRLIAVTAIILVAIVGMIFVSSRGLGAGAYQKTVEQVVKDKSLVGERVRVEGKVVPGSYDKKKTNPMVFDISTNGEKGEDRLTIEYGGTIPQTFGDRAGAFVTGELDANGKIVADSLVVKCPTKYESERAAGKKLTIAGLLKAKADMTGKYVMVEGLKRPGVGGADMVLEDGAQSLRVTFKDDAKSQAGKVEDGRKVVIGGSLLEDGAFEAGSVKAEKAAK